MKIYILASSQGNLKLLTLKLFTEYDYLIYSVLKESSLSRVLISGYLL